MREREWEETRIKTYPKSLRIDNRRYRYDTYWWEGILRHDDRYNRLKFSRIYKTDRKREYKSKPFWKRRSP